MQNFRYPDNGQECPMPCFQTADVTADGYPLLVRGKKLMSAFLLFDFVLSERISVRVHISLVDCLIDQGTELSHVLGYRIDRIALFP